MWSKNILFLLTDLSVYFKLTRNVTCLRSGCSLVIFYYVTFQICYDCWLKTGWMQPLLLLLLLYFCSHPITQQGRWGNHILILRYSTPTDRPSDWPSADKASGSNPELLKLSCPCRDSGTNGSCTDPDANKRALTSIRDLGPTCILMRRDQNQDTQWAPGCDDGDGREDAFSRCPRPESSLLANIPNMLTAAAPAVANHVGPQFTF